MTDPFFSDPGGAIAPPMPTGRGMGGGGVAVG